MKIEKIDRNNIKEYIGNLGIEVSYDEEKVIIDNETFGVKEDDRFLFGFSSLSEDSINITFGNKRINEEVIKSYIAFLNNSLAFNGHLVIQTCDSKVMDIMDDLYRVKLITVLKSNDVCSYGGNGKEKFADIDMKSIKYFDMNNGIECNLYSQNIQDEDIIKKLDDFFVNCDVHYIKFYILPDSLEYMNSLGYECVCKRYVI